MSEDKRPPREWFYPVVEKIKKEAPQVDDPKALAGWIWYRWMKPKTKKAILEAIKEGRKAKLGIKKITARMLKQAGVLDPKRITVKYSHGYYVIGDYATKSMSGLIDYLRSYGVSDEIIEEYYPKLKTLKHGEKIMISFDPDIKVRRRLIKKPMVLDYYDFEADGLIRVLLREDKTLFPELALYTKPYVDVLESLRQAGFREEERGKWVLRTDKFNIFVYGVI